MYYNLNDLMSEGGCSSGSSSGGSGSSGFDYDAEIQALQIAAAKIPTAFTINTLSIMKEDVRVMKEKFTYIPSNNSFNVQAWNDVINAVVKIPSNFQSTTLQELYDYVDNLKNNIPNTDSFNIDSWSVVFARTNMIPNTFNSNTLPQMYNNVNDLLNGSSGSGASGSSSGVDYSQDIKALQTAVNAIPSTFNSSTWTNVRTNISEILSRIMNLPYLPNLHEETYTWVKLVNAGKKVPESFLGRTLQTIKDNVDMMVDRFTYIPNINSFNIATWSNIVNAVTELQQTVSNMISQLNAQSLIDLNTLQAALDNADGSLETIPNRLQQIQ